MNKKLHYLTFPRVYVCKPPEDLVITAGLVHWLSTCAVGGKKMVRQSRTSTKLTISIVHFVEGYEAQGGIFG